MLLKSKLEKLKELNFDITQYTDKLTNRDNLMKLKEGGWKLISSLSKYISY